MVANIGVASTLVFYDSLLPHIAAPDQVDRVSTAGYAIGFIGGGILLLIILAWILKPALWGCRTPRRRCDRRSVSVGVWWLLFSPPLFRRCPSRSFGLAGLGASGTGLVLAAAKASWNVPRAVRTATRS